MTLEFFSATDTGRARNNNEDSVAVHEGAKLLALADGMGGYNAGEVASGMVTSFIKNELGRWLEEASADASSSQRPSSLLMNEVAMLLATSPAL